MIFQFAVGQFQVKLGSYDENYRKAEALIHQAAERNCDLILLPEMWLGGYDYEHFDQYGRETEGYLGRIKVLACELKIAIAGTYPLRRGGDCFNTMAFFDSSGNISRYEKLHLFSLMQEEIHFSPGEKLVSVSRRWGVTGLSICYDLRFPELFRRYTLEGAKVILISAEWPLSRIDHWKNLIQARAIENQVFIIAANAVGKSGKEMMGGASMIIDPWGRILAEGDSESELLITAKIDSAEIQKTRDKISVFKDRRPDIYG